MHPPPMAAAAALRGTAEQASVTAAGKRNTSSSRELQQYRLCSGHKMEPVPSQTRWAEGYHILGAHRHHHRGHKKWHSSTYAHVHQNLHPDFMTCMATYRQKNATDAKGALASARKNRLRRIRTHRAILPTRPWGWHSDTQPRGMARIKAGDKGL